MHVQPLAQATSFSSFSSSQFFHVIPNPKAASPGTDVNKVDHARAATQPTCVFTLVLTRAFTQHRTPVELATQCPNASLLGGWPLKGGGCTQDCCLQKWQTPYLRSQWVQCGVRCPPAQRSVGILLAARQSFSQKLPVNLPQSTQGLQSMSPSPQHVTVMRAEVWVSHGDTIAAGQMNARRQCLSLDVTQLGCIRRKGEGEEGTAGECMGLSQGTKTYVVHVASVRLNKLFIYRALMYIYSCACGEIAYESSFIHIYVHIHSVPAGMGGRAL